MRRSESVILFQFYHIHEVSCSVEVNAIKVRCKKRKKLILEEEGKKKEMSREEIKRQSKESEE
jgi:hypothetical protein